MAGELKRWGAGGEARIEEPKRREGGRMGGELENSWLGGELEGSWKGPER